jgi:hypothetical protein
MDTVVNRADDYESALGPLKEDIDRGDLENVARDSLICEALAGGNPEKLQFFATLLVGARIHNLECQLSALSDEGVGINLDLNFSSKTSRLTTT